MTGIDTGIIAGYFIITLIIGIWKSRGITSMQDFSIGDYKYCSSAIVATVAASLIGAENVLGISGKVFEVGLIFAIAWLGTSVNLCMVAKYVAPRMSAFRGMISAGDMMYSFYGKPGQVITGCASLLLATGYIGAQIMSIGYLCDLFLGISHTWGIIIGAGVVVIYASLGGIRAVTATDIIQFLVLIITIPIICDVGLNEVGGYLALFKAVPHSHVTLLRDSHTVWNCVSIFLIVSIPFLDPVVTQRLLMAGSEERIKRSIYITAIIFIPFTLIAGFIGLIALAVDPTIDPVLAFPLVVNKVLPAGLKGLTIAGMFAVIMSTADSYLNAASVTFVHDVIKPLKKEPLSDKNELRIARMTSFFLGVMAIVVATSFTNIIDIILQFLNFWGPVVVVPFFAGIFGLRASQKTFLIGVVAGLSTFALWTLFVGEFAGFDSLLPSMLMSAIAFFVSYYWKRDRGSQPVAQSLKKTLKPQGASTYLSYFKLKSYLPTLSNINRFSQRRVELYGAQYSTFGIFAMLMYLVPFFMWSPEGYSDTSSLGLRVLASILAGGLIFNDFWPLKTRKCLPVYWHFTLLYCLPFLTTYMLFKEGASLFWVLNMSLGLLFLAILVDWLSFVIIFPLGVFLGAGFYVMTHSMPSITLSAREMFLFFYMCFFSTLIGLIFSRNKELRESLKKAHAIKMQKMAEQVSHDIRSPAVSLNMFCKNLKGLSEAERDVIIGATNRITDISNTLLSKNCQEPYERDNEQEPIKPELIFPIIDALISEKRVAFARQGITLQTKISDYSLFAKVDRVDLQRVLCNLMNNAAESFEGLHRKYVVTMGMDIIGNTVRIFVEDNGCGIPQKHLEFVFEEGKTFGKSHGFGMGLTHAKQTVEEWGGCITIDTQENKGTRVTLELKKAEPPEWFGCEVNLQAKRIVIVDDVSSIHKLWESRLAPFLDEFELVHHYDPESFLNWFREDGRSKETQYLIDYTYADEQINGLDLIQKTGIAANALLVTSFFENETIHKRCKQLGVKLLPKYIVPYVVIGEPQTSSLTLEVKAEPPGKQVDLVMVDDARFFTESFVASRRDKRIDTYNTAADFLAHYQQYAKDTKFYIDGDIQGTDGGYVAKVLYDKGYTNLHILTGLDKGEYKNLPWIKSVIEKNTYIVV